METDQGVEVTTNIGPTTPFTVLIDEADLGKLLHKADVKAPSPRVQPSHGRANRRPRDPAPQADSNGLQAACMLAHELTQPFAAIANYVEACKRTLAPCRGRIPDSAFDYMDKAIRESTRAGKVISHLRCLFEGKDAGRCEAQINDIVERACATLTPEIAAHGIQLTLETDPALPPVLMDQVQIELVAINLLRNAIEALQGAAAKRLTVSTAFTASQSIVVTVADSGPGLSAHVCERLFLPVDSRKPHGMGIGLAICHAIVKAHAGRIWADTDPATETAFHFSLPVAAPAADGIACND